MKFGDKILVKASLKRIKGWNNLRKWERSEWAQPKEAIFLGLRTLSNGIVAHDPDMGGYYFEPGDYIKGAWICIKGRNPEKVFLSDCQPWFDLSKCTCGSFPNPKVQPGPQNLGPVCPVHSFISISDVEVPEGY